MVWVWRLGTSVVVLAWMGFIFYLSSLSQAGASRPLEHAAFSWLGDLRSYVVHLVLYGILASLVQTSLWAWKSDCHLRWALAAGAVAALYGVTDEYHQSFVSGRSASFLDMLVNGVAAIVAAGGLWYLVRGKYRRGRPEYSL